MRVLLSSVPAVAHVLALVPLARALLARGHEVALVSAPSAGPLLPPGVPLLAAGPDLPELLAPALANPAPPRPDGLPEGVGRFFGGIRTGATIGAARDAADAWRPDLVVSEGLDGVGVVLAAERRLPHVTLSLGPVCSAEIDGLVRDSLHEDGFATAPTDLRLDPWPAAMQPPGWLSPGSPRPVRPELALPDDGAPLFVPAGGTGDPVLVTLGTLWAAPGVLTPLVDGLTAAGWRVVIALAADVDPTAVTPAHPDRVALRPFGPLGATLTQVRAVVCHAGAATLLAAMIHGLPVVAVPQGSDHHINAAGLAASGAGLVVDAGAGPDDLATATAEVLTTPGPRAAAAGIAAGIAAMPPVATVAAELEALVGT